MSTGPSSAEIDDFLEQVNEVTAKIEAIKKGEDVDLSDFSTTEANDTRTPGEIAAHIRKINPKAVLTPQQEEDLAAHEREEAEKRAQRRKALEEADEAKRLQKKKEERERWWQHAEYEYGRLHEPQPEEQEQVDEEKTEDSEPKPKPDMLDYSRWEEWLKNPDDPVAKEALETAKAKIEEDKNDEFERNNPEFCAAFRADMEKRRKTQQTKEEKAIALKEKGNRAFVKKFIRRALRYYEEALSLKYDLVPVLTNIAQCHLRLKQYEDCLEYCNRALYVDPSNIKALSRRAKVRRVSKPPDFDEAIKDLSAAVAIAPDNTALRRELEATKVAMRAAKDEEKIMADNEGKFVHLRGLFDKLKTPGGSSGLQAKLFADLIAKLPSSQVYLRADGHLEWLTVTVSTYFERLSSEECLGQPQVESKSETTPLTQQEFQHATLILQLLVASAYDAHNLAHIRKCGVLRAASQLTVKIVAASVPEQISTSKKNKKKNKKKMPLAKKVKRLLKNN